MLKLIGRRKALSSAATFLLGTVLFLPQAGLAQSRSALSQGDQAILYAYCVRHGKSPAACEAQIREEVQNDEEDARREEAARRRRQAAQAAAAERARAEEQERAPKVVAAPSLPIVNDGVDDSSAGNGAPYPLYVVCQGTSYYSRAAERSYDVVVWHLFRTKNYSAAMKALSFVDLRWAGDHPRDTWKCIKFEPDQYGSESGVTRAEENYINSLSRKGYMRYLDDGPKNMWLAVPVQYLAGHGGTVNGLSN